MTDPHAESANPPSWMLHLTPLVRFRGFIVAGTLVCGAAAAGVSLMLPEAFSARVTFVQPQQNSASNATAALAAVGGAGLGNLAALGGGGTRTPADQLVALMQSTTVADRMIDAFNLMQVYGVDYRFKARKALADRVKMQVGRKDGLVSVEVIAHTPQIAADMANRYVDELKRMTGQLALTEAQQRRVFFEAQVKDTKAKLVQAQQALLASGYSSNTLKAEPRAAAEGYAKSRAELTSAEVKLQALRAQLAEGTPEIVQQSTIVNALRQRMAAQEQGAPGGDDPEYISRYREFKYQESLFDLFSRQYEQARVEEAKEGSLIQVVDPAQPPERRIKPVRSVITLGGLAGGALFLCAFVLLRDNWRRWRGDAEAQAAWRQALNSQRPTA